MKTKFNDSLLIAFHSGVDSAKAALLSTCGVASLDALEARLESITTLEAKLDQLTRTHVVVQDQALQDQIALLERVQQQFEEAKASYENRIAQLESALAERVAPSATPPTERSSKSLDFYAKVMDCRKRAAKLLRVLEQTPWDKLDSVTKGEFHSGHRLHTKHNVIVVPIDRGRRFCLLLRERMRGGQTVVVAAVPTADLANMKPEQVPTIEEVTGG